MNKHCSEPASALKEEICRKYNKFAPWYDLMEGVVEVLGLERLQRSVSALAFPTFLKLARPDTHAAIYERR